MAGMLTFTKMHGLGNDYLLIDAVSQADCLQGVALGPLAIALSDRHRGVGADGIILVSPESRPDGPAATMRILNSDGSEAQMCGNGLRCVARFLLEEQLISPGRSFAIGCGGRAVRVRILEQGGEAAEVWLIESDFGPPTLDPEHLPVVGAMEPGRAPRLRLDPGSGGPVEATIVGVGNPHAVIFVEDVECVNLRTLGPAIEHHPRFPERINAHLVSIESRQEVRMRSWERGAGETQACASGAAAVTVACIAEHRTDGDIRLALPGGTLQGQWDGQGGVRITGPAQRVFTGSWPL